VFCYRHRPSTPVKRQGGQVVDARPYGLRVALPRAIPAPWALRGDVDRANALAAELDRPRGRTTWDQFTPIHRSDLERRPWSLSVIQLHAIGYQPVTRRFLISSISSFPWPFNTIS
jgi:hypothetical protein